MIPYLHGLYKTIDNWRPFRRNDEGWKVLELVVEAMLLKDGILDTVLHASDKVPTLVKPVPRLIRDVKALIRLTSDKAPPKVV